MKTFFYSIAFFTLSLSSFILNAEAKVTFPGECVGQVVILSEKDVVESSDKYKSLSPLSIPVFSGLPHDLSVIAGAISLVNVTMNSHIQVKAKARRTPNLDASALEGGLSNPILKNLKDGEWIRMKLGRDNSVSITPATKEEAIAAYNSRTTEEVKLSSNTEDNKIYTSAELGWQDAIRVGSKAANYADLAKALNTAEREVVRPGYAIPFSYYQDFLNSNPEVKAEIDDLLLDPMMKEVHMTQYRAGRLSDLRKLMTDPSRKVSSQLLSELVAIFDTQKSSKGKKKKMKLRSSTNSEDLPNFNGAGLYTSDSYKPYTKTPEGDIEKNQAEKQATLKAVLQLVWSSVWELRAFDERNYFNIPHEQVKMGIQVNPSFGDELADGVVITKNIAGDSRYPGPGVYIEAQRGDVHSVANPEPGATVQKVLVNYDKSNPLDKTKYEVHVLQESNIADDAKKILAQANPNPVMRTEEIVDLVWQSLKAEAHFRPLHGKNDPEFSLDLEFKVDEGATKNSRQVYLKQARPYID